MSDRKPDFWVVKRRRKGLAEYYTCSWGQWERSAMNRMTFSESIATNIADDNGGKAVPVYCTTRKTNTMRERSSAWVLRRLAEGKVVMVQLVHNGEIFFQRFNAKNGFIEHAIHNTSCWKLDNTGFAVNGRVLCRVARSEEVEK